MSERLFDLSTTVPTTPEEVVDPDGRHGLHPFLVRAEAEQAEQICPRTGCLLPGVLA